MKKEIKQEILAAGILILVIAAVGLAGQLLYVPAIGFSVLAGLSLVLSAAQILLSRCKAYGPCRLAGLWGWAGVMALLLQLLGQGVTLTPERRLPVQILLGVAAGLPPVLALINQLLLHLEEKKWNDKSVAQMQNFLLSHRQEDQSPRLLHRVAVARRLTVGYNVILVVLAGTTAFCSGLLGWGRLFFFAWSGVVFACAFSRVRLPQQEKRTLEPGISRADYPALYALAEKAQKALGGRGELTIELNADCNAGLWMGERQTRLMLGAVLLAVASEEELYAVLLHEFGHEAAETKKVRMERIYSMSINDLPLGPVTELLLFFTFGYFDCRYAMATQLYELSVTLRRELEADQAMARLGNPEAAGSVLLKLAYFDFFCWEETWQPQLFAGETPPTQILQHRTADFCRAIQKRGAFWNTLAGQQIQPRSASHPTLRARLEAMGITDMKLAQLPSSDAYCREQERAMEEVDRKISENLEKTYAEDRAEAYLAPLKTVQDWEAAGRPVDAARCTDVLEALGQLRRYQEEEALCDRAIAELPPEGNHDACYIKGSLLLHRYDPAGIDYLYRAIEANTNHIEDGMSQIGDFCCLTGRQAELDTYRRRALELAQRQKDVYSQMQTLDRTDKLLPEQLPESLHRALVEVLRGADGGCLDRAYLVRKQITDDFFASAVVLRFDRDADGQACDEVYHQVFRFLDNATDWQFTLFTYEEVRRAHVEQIPGSCIYQHENP